MTKEERDAVQARCISIDNIIISIERELCMLRTHLDMLTKVCEVESQIDYKKWDVLPKVDLPTEITTCVSVLASALEDEPQTERHLPDYSYEADLGRRIREQMKGSE